MSAFSSNNSCTLSANSFLSPKSCVQPASLVSSPSNAMSRINNGSYKFIKVYYTTMLFLYKIFENLLKNPGISY